MSFFTSCWLLPQNEQYKFFSETEPFLSAINDALWFYFHNDNERKTAPSQKGGAVFKKIAENLISAKFVASQGRFEMT